MRIIDRLSNISLFYKPGYHYLDLSKSQLEAVSNFNKKILRKSILLEEVNCLCGNNIFSQVANIDRYGLIQSTVICKKCGLIQSNPRITPEYCRFFYESDEYRRLYDGNDFVNKFEICYNNNYVRSIYEAIIQYKSLENITSVLEFGAGGGWNLLPFFRHGILVRGYDFSEELVNLGNKKGISLIRGSINDIEGKYDVIIANHIIEHLTNFLPDMEKLKSHLNEDGLMYIGVPDIHKFSIGHLQNAHTYYFTNKTLQYYMARCGLRMVCSNSEIGGHMSAIFVTDKLQVDDKLLEGHYKEMAEIIHRYYRLYYIKHLISKPLDLIGLKGTVKSTLIRLKKL